MIRREKSILRNIHKQIIHKFYEVIALPAEFYGSESNLERKRQSRIQLATFPDVCFEDVYELRE